MPELESQGVLFKRGNGASPEVFSTVGQVVSFSGPSGSAAVIDVTNLSSTAKEKLMGLHDEGQISLEMNLDPADTAQMGLKTDRSNRTLRNFTLTLTDSPATVLSFSGYVLNFNIGGSVDAVITASVTIEIDGAVTWS